MEYYMELWMDKNYAAMVEFWEPKENNMHCNQWQRDLIQSFSEENIVEVLMIETNELDSGLDHE